MQRGCSLGVFDNGDSSRRGDSNILPRWVRILGGVAPSARSEIIPLELLSCRIP